MTNALGSLNITPVAAQDMMQKSLGGQLNSESTGNDSFSTFLDNALTELNNTQTQANQATTALVTGQIDDFHTPIIAIEKASMALSLAVTVRNKVLDAYHEIMRMQI